MSMKRLAVIAAVSSYTSITSNTTTTTTTYFSGNSIAGTSGGGGGIGGLYQGQQTMRPGATLHGNVNVLLGGAMLSVVITVVCVVCYCCHRNIKKRTASVYRQRWLENDANMEIYSVEQCYETSGLFAETPDTVASAIHITTANHGGPPPSYEAVVAMDEMCSHGRQSPPPGYRSSDDLTDAIRRNKIMEGGGSTSYGQLCTIGDGTTDDDDDDNNNNVDFDSESGGGPHHLQHMFQHQQNPGSNIQQRQVDQQFQQHNYPITTTTIIHHPNHRRNRHRNSVPLQNFRHYQHNNSSQLVNGVFSRSGEGTKCDQQQPASLAQTPVQQQQQQQPQPGLHNNASSLCCTFRRGMDMEIDSYKTPDSSSIATTSFCTSQVDRLNNNNNNNTSTSNSSNSCSNTIIDTSNNNNDNSQNNNNNDLYQGCSLCGKIRPCTTATTTTTTFSSIDSGFDNLNTADVQNGNQQQQNNPDISSLCDCCNSPTSPIRPIKPPKLISVSTPTLIGCGKDIDDIDVDDNLLLKQAAARQDVLDGLAILTSPTPTPIRNVGDNININFDDTFDIPQTDCNSLTKDENISAGATAAIRLPARRKLERKTSIIRTRKE